MIVVILLHLCAAENKIGVVTLSAGSWMSIGAGDKDGSSIYLNTLRTDVYATVFGLNLYTGVPLSYNIQTTKGSAADSKITLGSGSFYVAKKFGILEPRLGMVIPLFENRRYGVWVDLGNVMLKAGLGLNSTIRDEDKLRFSAEVEANIAITDTSFNSGWAFPGTFSIVPIVKAGYRPVQKAKLGGELLLSYKQGKYTWGKEYGYSVVPNLFGEYFLTPRWFIGAKAGVGPGYKGDTFETMRLSGYNVNLGISLNVYP
ncbi:MAG: hypothetical protein GF398_10085 [Chitinivibrionales bacterium]|nr:hypothetical protein [Chitinivibrionales bacterium]